MSNAYDFRAPPMSWAQVDRVADDFRDDLKMGGVPYFPVVDIVDKLMGNILGEISFEIGSHGDMGNAEGLTCPHGRFIRFREDVYADACVGGVRARFTFAHELGHYLLHTDENQPLARALPTEKLPAFRSAEKQANRFASTLLMPLAHINPLDDENELMSRFGVSRPAATFRLNDLRDKVWI